MARSEELPGQLNIYDFLPDPNKVYELDIRGAVRRCLLSEVWLLFHGPRNGHGRMSGMPYKGRLDQVAQNKRR